MEITQNKSRKESHVNLTNQNIYKLKKLTIHKEDSQVGRLPIVLLLLLIE